MSCCPFPLDPETLNINISYLHRSALSKAVLYPISPLGEIEKRRGVQKSAWKFSRSSQMAETGPQFEKGWKGAWKNWGDLFYDVAAQRGKEPLALADNRDGKRDVRCIKSVRIHLSKSEWDSSRTQSFSRLLGWQTLYHLVESKCGYVPAGGRHVLVMVVAVCDLLLWSLFFSSNFFGLKLLMAPVGVLLDYISGSPFELLHRLWEYYSTYGWALVFYTEQGSVRQAFLF